MIRSEEPVSGGVVHGGVRLSELRALGIRPEEVIDFSASVSPLGVPQGVREALAGLDLSAYPDPDCTDLREAIAVRDGVYPEQILVGNGSVEIIHLLARAYLQPDDEAAVFVPAFGEYAAACAHQTQRIREIRADERDSFRWPLPDVVMNVAGSKLIFVGNPNNPTGVYLDRDDVDEIVAASHGLLVLDEAYRPFVAIPWESTDLVRSGRVVLLRSLTKDYGLAGLRLGYCIAPIDVIARLRSLQVSWSVSSAAQVAGLAALSDRAYLERVSAVVRDAKAWLCGALINLGLPMIEGAANFVLVRIGNATDVRLRLLHEGLLVRDCTSFGLPSHIRIGVRTRPECERLVTALVTVLEELRAER